MPLHVHKCVVRFVSNSLVSCQLYNVLIAQFFYPLSGVGICGALVGCKKCYLYINVTLISV